MLTFFNSFLFRFPNRSFSKINKTDVLNSKKKRQQFCSFYIRAIFVVETKMSKYRSRGFQVNIVVPL